MARAETTAKLAINPVSAPVSSISIPSFSLPDGTVGVAYAYTLPTPIGGTPPYEWDVTPALPAGLTLDPATGAITGTPTAPLTGTEFTFSIV